MNNITTGFTSIEQVTGQYLKGKNSKPLTGATYNGASFQDILSDTVHFSKHASARLEQREIHLSQEQKMRLNDGMIKAGEKGIQDSLVLMDSLAFIVNVPSNTVVTALDSEESKEKAFTNIDGAVIV